jgi:hypothetical protein
MPPHIAESRGPESNITEARRHTTVIATGGMTITTTVIEMTTAKYQH